MEHMSGVLGERLESEAAEMGAGGEDMMQG